MSKPWYIELYEHFPDYDAEPYTRGTKGEVDFIAQELAHDRSKMILDVGCGTGRHALELGRRGYTVVGVDSSAALLAQGRATAQAENIPVTFITADARTLNFDSHFDVALSICEGAFSLMETDEMDFLILENIARALRNPNPATGLPGGKFILTTPNAAFMLANDSDEGTFDPVTCRETFPLEATGADGSKKTLHCSQRYYTCPELKCLLKQAGFRHVRFFGVTGNGFDPHATPSKEDFELGVIAEK